MDGVVLGGTRSGVGKTVATLVVAHALREAGHSVQPAKAGPDFVDPGHHEQVTGRPSRTLDPWLAGEDGMRRNYWRGTGDFCLVEGMMGLYDGDRASTARVASLLELPVVLVVDANAGMESVAATALGFRAYADRMNLSMDVAGVIAQRAHAGRHEAGIRDALPPELTYVGHIPPQEALEIPDRHLGLERGRETQLSSDALATAATGIETDRLLEIAREPPQVPSSPARPTTNATVAVASGPGFSFRYPATIQRLRERAEVAQFAPAAGDRLPVCDGVYLPGGYPELVAERLAEGPAVAEIAAAAADGTPILGECGGLLSLAESLTTSDGETHPMAGVVPADVRMTDAPQALDHVRLTATDRTLTAEVGETLQGHEFHYSTADTGSDARFAFTLDRGTGIDGDHDGLTVQRTLATYCHLHPESGAFDTFLDRL